jgi:hypothetical protein
MNATPFFLQINKKNKQKNMPIPTDAHLYDQVKQQVYRAHPIHSAYRSAILVQTYKKRFSEKHGPDIQPYFGKKKPQEGISRWFKEKWRNQRGEIGYQHPGDVYRPTKRVNSKTPITFSELSKVRIQKAQSQKKKTGRVKRF